MEATEVQIKTRQIQRMKAAEKCLCARHKGAGGRRLELESGKTKEEPWSGELVTEVS